MNICILTPRFPFPQYGGDTLRINEIARHLKRQGHRLVLVSLSDEAVPPVEQAGQLYDKVYFVQRNRYRSLIVGSLYFLKGKPIQCGYYRDAAYRKLLKTVVREEKPALYISHLLRLVPYLEELGLQDKSIVEMTDALSKTYGLSLNAKGVGLLKYVYALEQRLISQYEQHVIKMFPKVVLVSQADIDYLRTKAGGEVASLALHSNGVDYMEQLSSAYDPEKICFLGNMRSIQNQDAVIHFVKDIFPLIKAKRPSAKCYIIGSLPPENIQALEAEDVIITGFVDDLEAAISDACLSVAPIRVAAGIQNKVLVAMGCGVPVVMTRLISQAIPELEDGRNCFIRDDDQAFADTCLRLMDDKGLRNEIGREGYQMVRQYFSWEEKLKGFEKV